MSDQKINPGTESGKKIIKGAAILGIAGIIVKVIGAVFRIPVANLIGDTGMSYYSYAYAIYGTLLVLATSGMPVAISRLVAEKIALGQYKNAHKIYHISAAIMAVVGGTGFLICYFGSDMIAAKMGNPDAAYALRAISPAIFLVSLLAAHRGFFQGRQNMNPSALSEVTEQLVRAIVGISLAFALVSKGLHHAAAGAAFGATAGSFVALILMLVILFFNQPVFKRKILAHDPYVDSTKVIIKKIILIAVPIVIGAEIMPIMNLIDATLIINRLTAGGMGIEKAKSLYGLFTGFVIPIIGLPQIFTAAVAESLVPAISGKFQTKHFEETRSNIRLGLRTTMIMAFPSAFGIIALAEPILKTLYFNQEQAVNDAINTLMLLGVGVVFLALSQTTAGILQAINKQTRPVRNLAIGAVFKIVLTYTLVGIKSIGINGAAIATMTAYTIAFVLNFRDIKKTTDVKIDFTATFAKPAIASIIMAVVSRLVWALANPFIGSKIATALAIILGGVTYFVAIIMVRAIKVEEIESFPRLKKLSKIMRKFGA